MLVRETCAMVAAKAAHVTIDQHGEHVIACLGTLWTALCTSFTMLACCGRRGKQCRRHLICMCLRYCNLLAAIKSVAAGIGERELHVITTAGFDSRYRARFVWTLLHLLLLS